MNQRALPDEVIAADWDHVHLRVGDPEAVAAWFETMLDGEILRAPGRVDVVLGGQKIFLLKAPVTDKPSPPHPHRGLDHFGLHVKDVDRVAERLQAKGVRFSAEPHTPRPGIRIAFIEGPEGISIEILERDEKYR